MRKLIPFFLAAFVVAAFALPALAADPSTTTTGASLSVTAGANLNVKSHSHWFAGSVSSVGSDSLTVGVLWTRQHDDSFLNGQVTTVSVNSEHADHVGEGPDADLVVRHSDRRPRRGRCQR